MKNQFNLPSMADTNPQLIAGLEKAYALVSIEGKGTHVGRIGGLSLDADGTPVIDVDIDLASCTNAQYPNIITAEKMQNIEHYLEELENFFLECMISQSDIFANGLRLCKGIRTEIGYVTI